MICRAVLLLPASCERQEAARRRNKSGIYYRDVKAGESVTPLTKDFAGVTLLAPKIAYTK